MITSLHSCVLQIVILLLQKMIPWGRHVDVFYNMTSFNIAHYIISEIMFLSWHADIRSISVLDDI